MTSPVDVLVIGIPDKLPKGKESDSLDNNFATILCGLRVANLVFLIRIGFNDSSKKNYIYILTDSIEFFIGRRYYFSYCLSL